MTITYKAPNKKHFAIDRIVFHKRGRKVTAELLNTNAGLKLTCTSKKFVRHASNMASKYYTLSTLEN